jgi:hypothetical protein
VIKEGRLCFEGFYENVIYKHDVLLCDKYYQVFSESDLLYENYYQSRIELQFFLEAPNSFKKIIDDINLNVVQNSNKEIGSIYDVRI